MSETVILLRKVTSTRSTWTYLAGEDRGTLTVNDGEILYQLGELVEMFSRIYSNVSVVSPQLVKHVLADIIILFPEVKFVPLTRDLLRLFERAFAQNVQRRRVNPNALYVCSDASGGHSGVPAAWAWCSGGADGSYEVGYSGTVNTNVAELEGMMSAIVAHVDHPAGRVHVYSDSSNAVDDVTLLREGVMPKAAAEFGLAGLAEQTMDVLSMRNVTVGWVRGHQRHRLNAMADELSRFARQRFSIGESFEDFSRDLDTLYTMLDRA